MAKRKTRAKKQSVTKIQQMTDYLVENPDAVSRDIAEMFDAHSSQISTARKRAANAAAAANGTQDTNGTVELVSLDELNKDIRTIKRMGVAKARKVLSIIEGIQGG
jgi:hypothetical protein